MRKRENIRYIVIIVMIFGDEHIEEMIFVRVIEEKMRICDAEEKLTLILLTDTFYNYHN